MNPASTMFANTCEARATARSRPFAGLKRVGAFSKPAITALSNSVSFAADLSKYRCAAASTP